MPISSEWRPLAKKYKVPHLGKIKEGYLELTGEINPQSSSLPELRIVGNTGTYKWSAPNAHIYEYLWTISLTSEPGIKKQEKKESTPVKIMIRKLRKKFFSKRGWTHLLRKKYAFLLQLIFHTYGTPYLVRVLTTTLKPPPVVKRTMTDKIREMLSTTKSVRNLAKNAVPEKFGTLLDAVEILAKDTVPNYSAYPWYSKNFTALEKGQKKGLEGVEFLIDRKAFRNLGNRITGSVGIMFICKSQDIEQKLQPIKLEARAMISFKGSPTDKNRIWIPEKRGSGKNAYFANRLFLEINPKTVKSR